MRKLWSPEEDAKLVRLAQNKICKADIARSLNRPFSSVSGRLKRLGIKAKKKFPQNHVQITASLREIIDGIVISDATICARKSLPSAFIAIEQHPVRKGWLEYIQKSLLENGIESKFDLTSHPKTALDDRELPGGEYIKLRTLNYVELAQERTRWYPHGKKVIPKDIAITPIMLTHWLCGDGRGGDKKGTLGLCTHGFSKSDVELLISKLKSDLDIRSTIQKVCRKKKASRQEYYILIGRQDQAAKVQELINNYIPECCKYKLSQIKTPTKGRGRSFTEKELLAIQNWFKNNNCDNFTYKELGKELGIAASTAWRLKRKFK